MSSLSIVHKLRITCKAWLEARSRVSIILLSLPVKLIEGGSARRMPLVCTACQQRLSCSGQAPCVLCQVTSYLMHTESSRSLGCLSFTGKVRNMLEIGFVASRYTPQEDLSLCTIEGDDMLHKVRMSSAPCAVKHT